MGRDWYWGASKSSKRGGGRGGGGVSVDDGGSTAATGCMCAVFQLFDFHQFQVANLQQHPSFKTNSFISEEVDVAKGTKAPRNSFEQEKPKSLPLVVKEGDDKLAIPMGIQVRTNLDTRSKVHGAANDCCSSDMNSPCCRTPNLVARLMGLDILPDGYSPRSSSSSSSNLGPTNSQGNKSDLHHHLRPRQPLQNKSVSPRSSSCYIGDHFTGCRSLPETPRISSARKSDVDHHHRHYHHRLSLQINKEDLSINEESVMSRISSLRRKEMKADEENRSPRSHYARQMVKQAKESVSRKFGSDVTNVVKNREKGGKDELVRQLKSKKLSKALIKVADDGSSSGKVPEHKTKVLSTVSTKEVHISQPSLEINEFYRKTNASAKQYRPRKKVTEERFGSGLLKLGKPPQTSDVIMRNKQEEPFVRPIAAGRANISDKKCKRTSLSNDLLNVTVSNFLRVKKDPTPPATRIPQKQVSNAQESKRSSSQLSSCSSHSYEQQRRLGSRESINNYDTHNRAGGDTTTTTTGDIVASEYHDYITRVLSCAGVDKDTPLSFLTWFSPSHPLDPSTFYHLEIETFSATTNPLASTGQLRQQCNRKLLFHLVDEILVDILRPYMNLKPWIRSFRHRQGQMTKGSHLVDELCSKVGSFPRASCQVPEDIDAIIDKDLPKLKFQSEVAFDHEGEEIVLEIQNHLLDTLVYETASMLYG